MFRVENNSGKLIEIQVSGLRDLDEMHAFRDEVLHAVENVRGAKGAVVVVDLRLPRVFSPEVATSLENMLKRANPRIQRSAVLLAQEHAVFSLQLERLIREAQNPSRRTFRDVEPLREWLSEVLTPAEQSRLDRFLV